MEKRRNSLIEIYFSLGNAYLELCSFSEEMEFPLKTLWKNLQKHLDLNDSKFVPFLTKYHFQKKFYGKYWKLLLKQFEEKPSTQHQDLDEKLLQVVINDHLRLHLHHRFFSLLALSNIRFEIFNILSTTFNHR